MSDTVAKFAKHVNPRFVKLLGVLGYGRVFTKARDTRLWDDEGREYLDALAGFGAVNIGHNHPRLVKRLQEALASDAMNLVHVGPSEAQADLAERLAALSPGHDVALFASGGAEAVEAALKLARAATGRTGFVHCRGAFHGTSLGTLAVMGEDRLRKPFEPLMPSERIPFGDLVALERAMKAKPAAFIVEPILGEGGVVLPPAGYLKQAAEMCGRAGALFIVDEVQTGLGRTGSMFACEAADVRVLGKSLGGSLVPISAALTTRELHERAYGSMDRFDLHSSTFGGNTFACVAAMETLSILKDEDLVARSADRGARLLRGLRERLGSHPLVKEIRGAGLLVGVELGTTGGLLQALKEKLSQLMFGQWVALRLLERGIVCQPASQQWNVIRIEPPLTIAETDIDRIVATLGDVLDEYHGLSPVIFDVAGRITRQFRRGWAFA